VPILTAYGWAKGHKSESSFAWSFLNYENIISHQYHSVVCFVVSIVSQVRVPIRFGDLAAPYKPDQCPTSMVAPYYIHCLRFLAI
jgi:hypothetical protein